MPTEYRTAPPKRWIPAGPKLVARIELKPKRKPSKFQARLCKKVQTKLIQQKSLSMMNKKPKRVYKDKEVVK